LTFLVLNFECFLNGFLALMAAVSFFGAQHKKRYSEQQEIASTKKTYF